MATNTYKLPGKKTVGGSFFSLLDKVVPMDDSLAQVIHVRFLPQILFICLIAVIYIGSRHHAEKRIRTISRLEVQVEDLRADYTTLKAGYKYDSKQSEVAKKAASIGLIESAQTPYKIIVNKE